MVTGSSLIMMGLDGWPFALPSPLEWSSVSPAPAGCRKGSEMSLPDLHVRLRREFVAHPGSPLALGFLLSPISQAASVGGWRGL